MAKRLIIDSCTHLIPGLRGRRVSLRPGRAHRAGRAQGNRGRAQAGEGGRRPDRGAVELSRPHRRSAARHRLGLLERRLPQLPQGLRAGQRPGRAPRVLPAGVALVFRQVAGPDGQLHRVARRPDLDRLDHREPRFRRNHADAKRCAAHPPHGLGALHVGRHPDGGRGPGLPAVEGGLGSTSRATSTLATNGSTATWRPTPISRSGSPFAGARTASSCALHPALETYFRFFNAGGSALAVVVNADQSKGPDRLLYAINPDTSDAAISIGEIAVCGATGSDCRPGSVPFAGQPRRRPEGRGCPGTAAAVMRPLAVRAVRARQRAEKA